NHTLPTSGSALFTGGLSVRHFLKTVTTLRTTEGAGSSSGLSSGANLSGWKASVAAAEILATAEGLSGHALAARYRKE
ncbi:MAG TPA: histidinol dehydrogenase, partial [Treponemataceae bacterium]|nr:histidinol dehydrogenase [Treponemataceae bacterium]